jgi:hypothetical protein
MTLHTLHLSRVGIGWCVVTILFMCLSTQALLVFGAGIRNARGVPVAEKFRRAYALDKAWDYFLSEMWRFLQHLASFLVGAISFFITPIPPHQIPADAALFGQYVTMTLFFINFCAGANTVRALRTWRRREELVRPIKRWPVVWPPKEDTNA